MNGLNNYMEHVKREIAARHALREANRSATVTEASKPVHVKIQEWWQRLDPSQRKPSYTMEELVKRFETSPGCIGMALHQLGWKRKRSWAGHDAAYRRHWIPAAI